MIARIILLPMKEVIVFNFCTFILFSLSVELDTNSLEV